VVFAINEYYDPATKRLEEELKKLRVVPANFVVRYERVLEGPFNGVSRRRIVEELAALVEEVTQLARGAGT
jgi:hypothetical protein